ncbi:hypothetical protein SAMN05421823_102606 [Catalinimonas alkaloidigena]|uniref:Uncharacterized protein n=1 Tax=Catalinimonas alkaloidigena TaxID=1075417 RepID=A0A1G9BHY1_9BACT|nr:hypothetical protein [Catalinimonas alkaloidigena]SDK38465.1 hypothetical protein SAMN05421823_102606 [Catalinimonas alkaloidigena]
MEHYPLPMSYFMLSFKVDGEIRLEGIHAPTLSIARDKLRLYHPDCYDINTIAVERTEDLHVKAIA